MIYSNSSNFTRKKPKSKVRKLTYLNRLFESLFLSIPELNYTYKIPWKFFKIYYPAYRQRLIPAATTHDIKDLGK